MARSGLFYVRFMDGILVLTPTRWKLRKAVKAVNEMLGSLGLEKHLDMTFIGRRASTSSANQIFAWYADGYAPCWIASELNRLCVPAPRSETWEASAIYGDMTKGTGLLNNQLYIGRYVWFRSQWVKDADTGRRLAKPLALGSPLSFGFSSSSREMNSDQDWVFLMSPSGFLPSLADRELARPWFSYV